MRSVEVHNSIALLDFARYFAIVLQKFIRLLQHAMIVCLEIQQNLVKRDAYGSQIFVPIT